MSAAKPAAVVTRDGVVGVSFTKHCDYGTALPNGTPLFTVPPEMVVIGFINEFDKPVIEKMDAKRLHFIGFNCGFTLLYEARPAP